MGNYSWYDSGKAVCELGYHLMPIETSLAEAVTLARQRLAGTYALNLKVAGKTADGPPPGDDDRLLITGSPGWLGNRFIDILINGDRFGEKYARRARCGSCSILPRRGSWTCRRISRSSTRTSTTRRP